MADEASIRMTVDNSQAMAENQKYIRAATETFNILKQKSIELGISEKQRLDWMQREVELMKERSRLSSAETVNRLYEDPKLSTKDRGQLVRQTRIEGREDIEELKQVNKHLKELENDQKTSSQKAERLGDTFSRMAVGMAGAETAGAAAGAAGSGLLGGLGATGIMAILGGILISKGLKGAATMEPALRDYSVLTGKSLEDLRTDVGKVDVDRLSNMGMKLSDYYPKASQLIRAGGGFGNEDMLSIIAGEKAKGISLAGVAGVERYDKGTVTNIERYFERYLRETSQNIAVLPEILQAFSSEGTRLIHTVGHFDSSTLAASISAVSKTFGLKGEPLQAVYGTLVSGLQQSSNPVIQAMQYSAMERALPPGSDLFDLQLAMEDPMKNPKYMVNTLNMLKGMSGGNRKTYARSILQYGLAPSLSLANDMAGKDINERMFTNEKTAFDKTPVGGYEEEAKKRFGALEKLTDKLQGEFEKKGFTTSEKFFGEINTLFGNEELKKDVKVIKDKVVGAIDKWEAHTQEQHKHDVYMANGGADSLRVLREQKYHLKQIADSTAGAQVK